MGLEQKGTVPWQKATPRNERINVLFPIEIMSRELDYRLFLACLSASKSNRIFVGASNSILNASKSMRGGIYLGKHVFEPRFRRSDLRLYRSLKDRGFVFVYLTEEGGIIPGPQSRWGDILLETLDPSAFDAEDYLLCWGRFQKQIFEAVPSKCRDHIIATGSPRFEIYKAPYREIFRKDVTAIQRRLGRFVLVNTNFAMANNGQGLADTFSNRLGLDPKDAQKRRDVIEEWRTSTRRLTNVIKLINELSLEFPDIKVLVRPHPSEDIDFYRTIFRDFSNVLIEREGAVIPWLMAAEALLHDGCTTALEAWFLNKPIISFPSEGEGKFTMPLPNEFGVRCETVEAAVEATRKVLKSREVGSVDQQRPSALAEALIENITSDVFLNVKNIMDKVESEIRQTKSIEFSEAKLRARQVKYDLVDQLKYPLRMTSAQRRRVLHYSRGKFMGFKKAKLDERLKAIQEILGVSLAIKKYGDHLFSIEKD